MDWANRPADAVVITITTKNVLRGPVNRAVPSPIVCSTDLKMSASRSPLPVAQQAVPSRRHSPLRL